MSRFDESVRVLLDNSTDNLNSQISAELAALDLAAAEIRKHNAVEIEKNGKAKAQRRDPEVELRPRVELLMAAVERARLQTVAALDGEISELQNDHQKKIDAKPDLDLLKLRRAENFVDGLTDDQVRRLPVELAEKQQDCGTYTINLLRARLRRMGDAEGELGTLTELSQKLRWDTPWLQTDEGAELAELRDDLASLKGSEVLYKDPRGSVTARVEELVDYGGELLAAE